MSEELEFIFVAEPRVWKIRSKKGDKEYVRDRVIIYVPKEIAEVLDLNKRYVVKIRELRD